ncbi:MAG: PilC/PilY family type IV pilus protein, partial [Proteobacteria bacterium]|nr:PilC/PilY family type IV pilus protein [Pseudomonadota bacterium]
NGLDDNKLCSAKPIGNGFGAFAGLCPEAPTQKGTYLMAGMAHYANTNRIRTDLPLPPARENSRDLMVTTYGIALATNVPKIEVQVGGRKVTILPAYRLDLGSGRYGGGTLVDFKIVEEGTNSGGNKFGKYYVNWEDSEMGGDYDMDMWGIIEYEVISDSTIKIKTTTVAAATANPQGFGYVISGTTQDGAHFHSGIYNFYFTDSTGVPGCTNCVCANPPSEHIYTVIPANQTAEANLLEDPLWYAAKWGGPLNSSGNPVMRADGSPANYFYAINPLQLENALNQVFLNIVKRSSSGTAVAVAANVSGAGALYQAYYEPLRQDGDNREVSWIGTVQALWVDSDGYLREDGNGNGKLDGYQTDQVVTFDYDESTNQTKIRRYASTRDDKFTPLYLRGTVTAYNALTGAVTFTVGEVNGTGGPFANWTVTNLRTGETSGSLSSASLDLVQKTFTIMPAASDSFVAGDAIMASYSEVTTDSLENLKPLWNARQQLSQIAAPETQRSFAAPANTGRFIKTWIDSHGNGIVDPGDFINFVSGMAGNGAFGYLDVDTAAEANKIINYIRGQEVTGFRNRTIDYDNNHHPQVMRLGDVVHSSPTVVGAPESGYDLAYRDTSYTAFRRQYADRRQMVYVGANDGMLHAFNGGFYKAGDHSFSVAGTAHDGVAATQHPLGSEIWAYVPMNLLPHLKWLTIPKGSDPDAPDYLGYQHTYYLDGQAKVFDAKIFAPDADHPQGWGTVLVIGMRFGGGPMAVDIDGNTREFRSAYVIMDVTNPEVEPRLLAEIPMPDASFTLSNPAVAIVKDKQALQDANKWFLVFGSGPTDLVTASTGNNAHLFIFDLAELASPGASASGAPQGCARAPLGSGPMFIYSCDTGAAASFAGDPVVVDWDLDYKADSIYFGTAGGPNQASGRMMRLDIGKENDPLHNPANPADWSAVATVIDVAQPIVAAPTLGVDGNRPRNKWVFFGTGRFLVNADLTSTATQSIYGVIDNGTEANKINLRNTSEARVGRDGALTGLEGESMASFDDLLRAPTNRGWYLDLPPIQGTAGVSPATRGGQPSVLAGGILFTTVYQPSQDQCAGEGSSRLYGLNYTTGTAHPRYGLGTYVENGKSYSASFVELGSGLASAPVFLATGANTGKIITQTNAGIDLGDVTTPNPVGSGWAGWRER